MPTKLDVIQRSLGRIELRQNLADPDLVFEAAEFQVYSQWGEDGLIQFLIARVPITSRIFIEFGVESYREANTRFLVQNDNWSGLVIDGSADNITKLRADNIYWRHNIKARCAFVDASNIEPIIASEGIHGDIGLLSIDIDGNDYWVWQAITSISPRLVICEFNALFGPRVEVSVPYEPTFVRETSHYSHLYYGASLSALTYLAQRKGYALVGTNSNSNNAFFVRNDLLARVRVVSPAECFRPAQYREARDRGGNLLYLTQQEALEMIAEKEVLDVRTETRLRIRDFAQATS